MADWCPGLATADRSVGSQRGELAGASFQNTATGSAKGEAQYYYPNDQSARLVWYHDHAIGTTRLNAYAGIASGYIIRDDVEDFLIGHGLQFHPVCRKSR